MVYPGAVHTRFEHSLGVMHVATKIFDNIVDQCREMLDSEYGYKEDGLNKVRTIIRLAALLHDVGHPPFSHAGESIMPYKDNGKLYKHEDYSSEIVKTVFKELIEDHKFNNNYGLKAEDVAAFIVKDYKVLKRYLFWTDIISGQVDADRIDYLLRDSYHIGVRYGVFDLDRLLKTIVLINTDDMPILSFKEGGLHVAESLILARYYMFTQVYFHHTRRAYDYHIKNAVKEILVRSGYKDGRMKRPDGKENIYDYLMWDDWKVGNLIKENADIYDCGAILNRDHYRCVYHTNEVPNISDLEKFHVICEKIRNEIDNGSVKFK
ncbi:HD domain-containing protein [Caldanaerobius polysaccharolyticus]|uniref:HD domain-containing protein n=1 Tax=Caldanaerobius polysaccharolyticus TaxID=44256 RepID=UPI0024803629|nr:HD domain-containing protein [Caldanaerobius polysaccharolyticus]